MNIPGNQLPLSGGFHLFQRETRVVKEGFVGLKQGAVFIQDNSMLRKAINELPQLMLVLSKLIFSLRTMLECPCPSRTTE
jgi:hypothetical protein